MKEYSIWKDTVQMKQYSKLEKDLVTDVLIIGGGMTGINTLFQLEKSNMEVILVEQNKIGMGVTANTTGKLNFLQDSIYEKIIKNYDDGKAREYLNAQLDAIQLAVSLIREQQIDCDLEKTNAYVYTNCDKEISKIDKLSEFLSENGIETFEGSYPLVEFKRMIGVENTYLFHPLKFVNGLLDKVHNGTIFEDTSIQKIEKKEDKYICYTKDDYKIEAKWVVIASHYPYFNLPYLFPIRGSLEKSYLSASKYKKDLISLISYKNPIISIRNYQDYLLYLSNSHTNSIKVDDKKNYQELMKKLSDLDLSPDYIWSNIDIITNDGLPYIGEIEDNLLIGTGYNTWGMTNGILAGKILSDIILENKNEYIELFSPRRFSIGDIVSAISDGKDSIVGYVNGYFSNSEKIEYEMIDGKEVAVYCDEKGEHKVYAKCPHMGCHLIFNEVECTWDCPCHASRFDIDGKCISGPSNQDITYKVE